MPCNISVTDWLYLSPNNILSNKSDCWPWTNISKKEWLIISSKLVGFVRSSEIMQGGVLTICLVGIIGSFCCIAAFKKKAVIQKERFYVWMFAIAIMELFVDIFGVFDSLRWGYLFPNVFQYHPWSAQLVCAFYGLNCGIGMATDVCALAVTVERYFAISGSQWIKSSKSKMLFTYLEIIAAVLVGITCTFR